MWSGYTPPGRVAQAPGCLAACVWHRPVAAHPTNRVASSPAPGGRIVALPGRGALTGGAFGCLSTPKHVHTHGAYVEDARRA